MPAIKKLIEVAMPIKEISAESVRDKSIRHGHISTLHLWWARRPLPVCRAVVFASLVFDPLDENCPAAFREAVQKLLYDPIYKPYHKIPYTTIEDEMPDNLRNRLLMFIGKFSDTYVSNAKAGKQTPAKDYLTHASLIKWDNKNNEDLLNIARKLIWVAYHAEKDSTADFETLSNEYDRYYQAIKDAEKALYQVVDRNLPTAEAAVNLQPMSETAANEKDLLHIVNLRPTSEAAEKETALVKAIAEFQDRMPSVFDPFAGGGAIPLEASRLGCRSYGNDINPVAHIIEKCSLEFPQKYGKKIIYSRSAFENLYGKEGLDLLDEKKIMPMSEADPVEIPNRLSFDVEYYARHLLRIAEGEARHLYPANENGNRPIAYYWARTATCSNPSCRAEVPLLKQFYMVNTATKKVYLWPVIHGTIIDFEIAQGVCEVEGWNKRGNLSCPCCGSITDVNTIKGYSTSNKLGQRLLAVIEESQQGKAYRVPRTDELSIVSETPLMVDVPSEDMQRNSAGGDTFSWGITKWGQLFSNRQLFVLQTLISALEKIKNIIAEHRGLSSNGIPAYAEMTPSMSFPRRRESLLLLHNQRDNNLGMLTGCPHTQEKAPLDIISDYDKAVISYLGVLMDRIAIANTSFGIWHTGRETLERIMGRQAIPMVFDYPESNPFCSSTGSSVNQLEWITRYIESESSLPFAAIVNHASSGKKDLFRHKQINAVVTDPPYYDAIAYADISDFFYVWLKRTLSDVYPLNFATPQTPKTEECTALKHHHDSNYEKAKAHFENKLLQIFSAIEHQTSDIVSIMYAHQSTEAWSTLCNSILGARMNITGSWSTDTEMTGALKTDKAFLASSVTVSCRPSQREDYGSYRQVKKGIEERVAYEVEKLYGLGFRGADLLTACFGQAVSEFGKYRTVERADGSVVTVADLLDMAREAALNALLKGFSGDEYTKFYIGWLQLNGLAETDFDDAAKFTRIGLSIDVGELFARGLLARNGNKQSLATFQPRTTANRSLGMNPSDSIIDQAHRAMNFYGGKESDRAALIKHIATVAPTAESPLWRVLTSLSELLPAGDDKTQADGLLVNRDNLLREILRTAQPQQRNLF